MRSSVLALVLSLSLASLAAAGQGPAAPAASVDGPIDVSKVVGDSYRAVAYRLQPGEAPELDGRLDDAVWQRAPVQGQFVQREPQFGYPASERTEFRVLYDDRMLYFGIWLYDRNPQGILGSELKRDAMLSKGDAVKIIIDTFHDHRNAFYFSTNPLGAYKDANSVENGRTLNYDWNAVWENHVTRDDQGWYVEMAVPLSQLRFAVSAEEAVWGLNICRVLLRNNEEDYWVPFPREWTSAGFARVSNAGVLTGLGTLQAKRRLEFVPYLLPSASRDYVAGTPVETTAHLGGDLKVGLTDNLMADLTYRTDFAQVEADQEVVNLTRFSLFFPEKRQFFTESAGIFDYGKALSGLAGDAATNDPGMLALFYSRRIGLVDGQEVPILGGGRVTGRVGGYTVGALNITTDTAEVHQGSGMATVDRANFTVVRVKRNILKNSSIGALFLDAENGVSAWNRAVGFDAGLTIGPAVTLTGLFAKTFTPGTSGGDTASVVDFAWKNDRYSYGVNFTDIGERFNAEMGYIPRLDIRSGRAKVGWSPRPKWKGVRQLLFNASGDYYETHAGRVDSRTQIFDATLQQQNTASAKIVFTRNFDDLASPFTTAGTSIAVGGYSWQTTNVSYSSNRTKRVFGTLSADAGGYYNGTRQAATASLSIQVGRTLLFEPNVTRNWVSLPGRPEYTSNVLNFRVSHSFSPDFYVKAFAQYNDDRKTASFNALMWYHFRPGSDIYVVYNQGWDVALPLTSAQLESNRVHSRSLVLKTTWWLSR